MGTSFRLRGAAVGLSLAVALASSYAGAQDAAMVTARRNLLDQAQQARTARDHRRALDLAERAGQIQMTTSLRLFVAEEQNELQMYAQASGNAELCVREGERDATMRNRDAILSACRALTDSLRARLGRVTIDLAAGLPDSVHVVVAGTDLNHALFGVPYTVNPGPLVIDAMAPGYASFHREVTVTPGATIPVRVEMTREATQVVAVTSATNTSAVPPVPSDHHGPGVAPWVVAGVGGALLISSAVLYAVFAVSSSQFEQTYCAPPTYLSCYDTMAAHDHSAALPLYSGLALGTLIGGVAIAGAGVLWGVLGGRGNAAHDHTRAHLELAPTPGGLMLGFGGSL